MPVLSLNSRLQKELLGLARKAVTGYLETGTPPAVPKELSHFDLHAGCFVTLRKAGSLRGCVGTFDARQPLVQNLIRMAVASATQDTRFPPVHKKEMGLIHMEISVLSELQKIESLEAIEIGRHGVYVKYGDLSGTFLPEVALAQKWGPEEFVLTCAREKAGLSPEECARAEVFVYEIQKFSEEVG